MNSKWVIFSDVDGTIYPFPDKTLSDVNKNKVVELKTKGVDFVINTGNPPLEKIKRLAKELNARYICCSNGAMIYDVEESKPIHIEYMNTEEAKKVWPIAERTGVLLYYMGTDQYYLHGDYPKYREFLTTFNEYNDWIDDGRINDDLHKIEAYGEPEQVAEFYKQCKEANLDFEVVNILDKYVEITNHGVSKASGLKWLCANVFDAKPEEVMAIGDSKNDVEMFKAVGYSYAMDNADAYTKSVAKYYTSAVEQDGLAEAIDDYLYRTDVDLKRAISQGKIKPNHK
ncbi:HAD family phosphatase [Mycoplasma sp. Pen4]|uniref:HAD family hydrolase n=1 Tax=Mycoplasma sp. Pen4 TaxID=640330 RepID=UPI0016549FCF|nr:HAD family hydrolase [Mycoplasma sp. Pen4]QNM93454.1 HAD family phosphatase [Mycoplasma sp. Pen4]